MDEAWASREQCSRPGEPAEVPATRSRSCDARPGFAPSPRQQLRALAAGVRQQTAAGEAALVRRFGRPNGVRPRSYLSAAAAHPMHLLLLGATAVAAGLSSFWLLPVALAAEFLLLRGLPRDARFRRAVDRRWARRRSAAVRRSRHRCLEPASESHRARFARLDGLVDSIFTAVCDDGDRDGQLSLRGIDEVEFDALLDRFIELAVVHRRLGEVVEQAPKRLATQPHSALRVLETDAAEDDSLRQIAARRRAINRRVLRLYNWAAEQQQLVEHRLEAIAQVIELAHLAAMAPAQVPGIDSSVEQLLDETDYRHIAVRLVAELGR